MCEGESWTFVGTTDFSLPVKNNTDSMNRLSGICSYQGGGPCHRGFWTCVGTTDGSPPVKNNTDRMSQLVR